MKTKISTFIIVIIILLLGTTTIAAQGTNVYFRKNGVTIFETTISNIDSIVFRKTSATVLPAPNNVNATAQSSNSINVSWDPVTGATSYKVYYAIGSSGTMTLAGTYSSNYCTISGLQPNITYYIYVKAVNSTGVESDYSSPAAQATTSASTVAVLPAPHNVNAVAQSSSSINVSWDPVTGATSYKVYYAIGSSGAINLAGTYSSNYCTISGLQPNITYYIYVKTVNSAGVESDNYSSPAAQATTPASTVAVLPAPNNVNAVAQSSSSINVTWSAVSGAASYKVYFAVGSSSPNPVTTVPSSTTSYLHQGLAASTVYNHYITAVNSAGVESALSAAAPATTPANVPLPGTPTGVSASQPNNSSSVTVTWNAAANAASYNIYRGTTAAAASMSYIGYCNSPTTSYVDAGPFVGGTTYYYQIIARNSAGTLGTGSTPYPYTYTSPPAAPKQPVKISAAQYPSGGAIVMLTYSLSDKSIVDKYTYELYVVGNPNPSIRYSTAPNSLNDNLGGLAYTTPSGSSYIISLVNKNLSPYNLYVKITSGNQSINTITVSSSF